MPEICALWYPNLAQAKTISYELGFDQSFDTYLIQ